MTENDKTKPWPADRALSALRTVLGLGENEEPFPWQERLLALFLDGGIPAALDIPTGLGKTSVMAIWLVARAAGARVPRRLVYVVDRRAVVDQATTVAEKLRKVVENDASLKAALGLTRSLPISTLRGQFVDNRQWLEDPSAPAIVLGTVDMVGSRLLFSGYGVSRKMAPYHAGLLGADSLIVLDEAHLTPAFERLIEQLATGVDANGRRLRPEPEFDRLVPRLRCLSLSATGREREAEGVFGLDENDRKHKEVCRRLGAEKRLVLRTAVGPKELPQALANEGWAVSGGGSVPSRILIFCNSRENAQEVQEALVKLSGRADSVELFVGGRRIYEREEVARWLEERGFIAGSEQRFDHPTFVVATAAGEVGVDLDADHAVCDLVAWERMVQRFGRVNRRGRGKAQVVGIPTARDKEAHEALAKFERWRAAVEKGSPGSLGDADGEESENDDGTEEHDSEETTSGKVPDLKAQDKRTAERALRREATEALIGHLRTVSEGYDVSPDGLLDLRKRAARDEELAQLVRAATTPAPLHPPLTRALVEAWSMTSLEEHTGRPEVAPWIRGWLEEDDPPQTTVVWRTHLPVTEYGKLLPKRDLETFRDAADPHLAEQLETESRSVFEWLTKRTKAFVAQRRQEAASEGEEAEKVHLIPLAVLFDEDNRPHVIRSSNFASKKERDVLQDLLRGATLLVDRRLGGLRSGLLDTDVDEAIDVTEVGEIGDEGPRRVPFRVRRVEAEEETPEGWRTEARIPVSKSEEGETEWLVIESVAGGLAESEEGRSTATQPQLLDKHQEWTEEEAQAIATNLALPNEYIELLKTAARLHDEGKKADRWQRAFNAPNGGKPPYAKTKGRPNVALLEGYRHELGSLPYVEAHSRTKSLPPPLRELCLHVVAAHHGHARPLLRTTGSPEPPSRLIERAQEVALRFAALEKLWGPWGLAWWEALLRAADQRASRRNDAEGGRRG